MESPHPQVLKIARNPCGVIGRLLFGSIHWDLPDLFIYLPQRSFFSRKHCHFADPLIGTGVWENVFSYLRERLQDIRQLA